MSKRPGDPLDELHHADPAQTSRPPSDSKARVWARIEEATMDTEAGSTTRRRPLWALGAAAAAVAAVVMAVIINSGSGSQEPGGDPGAGIGPCVESYSLDTLANRDFAFDGTVTAIDGDQVTFDVNEAFGGDLAETVTLTATGMTGTAVTSAGGPILVIGERYLVAGDGEFAWACGFTQPYEAAAAAQWAEAAR